MYLYPNLDQRDLVHPHFFQKLTDVIVIEYRHSSKLSRNIVSSYIVPFRSTTGDHKRS